MRLRGFVIFLYILFVYKMKFKVLFSIIMVFVCNGYIIISIWLNNVCGWDYSVVRGVNY